MYAEVEVEIEVEVKNMLSSFTRRRGSWSAKGTCICRADKQVFISSFDLKGVLTACLPLPLSLSLLDEDTDALGRHGRRVLKSMLVW